MCWLARISFHKTGGKLGCPPWLSRLWAAHLMFMSYAFQRRCILHAMDRVCSTLCRQGGPTLRSFQFQAYSAWWTSSLSLTCLKLLWGFSPPLCRCHASSQRCSLAPSVAGPGGSSASGSPDLVSLLEWTPCFLLLSGSF